MLDNKSVSFKKYVHQLLIEHKGKRIYKFKYKEHFYWLKQPEKLKGVWHILKPYPQKSFKRELDKLHFLMQKKAPIPNIVYWGSDFFVLEDAGKTSSEWLCDNDQSINIKNKILIDIVNAILSLHQNGLVHGRPAIRDIIWNNGQVLFIDFESNSLKLNLLDQKHSDILIFIHSLGREAMILNEQIRLVIDTFRHKLSKEEWYSLVAVIKKWRYLYYILLIFKPLARTDLIAIYRLFENFFFIIEKND